MQVFTTTLTQRGQITVPAEVRRLLGVGPRDKLTFVIDDGQVRLQPARFTWETARASVRPLRPLSSDLREEIEEAMNDHAEQLAAKLQSS